MAEAKIEIVDYDPKWPSMFEEEKRILLDALGEWVVGGIEHVGSTAVPQLSAKPIIDIMLGVQSLESSRPAIKKAEKLGYCYFPYKDDVMHWFCKPSPSVRTHHLHMVPFQSDLWNDRLMFRDAMRTKPELAVEYQNLKITLADAHSDDREKYTSEKGPFVARVLSEMRR